MNLRLKNLPLIPMVFSSALFFLMAPPLGAQTASPRRVISLSPSVTEILYDIGAQDQLVGVTRYCKFPAEAQLKEKIGGWLDPNIEKIVSLKPDLAILVQSDGKDNQNVFHKLGISVLAVPMVTISDVLKAYDLLGEKMGRSRQAAEARRRLENQLNFIRARGKKFTPLSVLFVIGHDARGLQQIYGVGPGNFIDELVTWAGGANILSNSKIPYPLVSKEEMLKQDPDIVIDALPKTEVKDVDFERRQDVWKKLPGLKAVREGRVYCFSDPAFTIPGPTMVKLAQYLSDIFEKARVVKK